jgi:outer membrane protein insertion porin family
MLKYFLSIIFILFFSFSVSSEVVEEIIVVNNDRISKATITNFSRISLGDDINEDTLNKITKDLYETNFFSDVSVKFVNNKLTINVKENKIIQSVTINGLKAKKFKKAIFDKIILKDKSPYVEYLASKDLLLVKEALLSQGFYFAEVKSSLVENANNTVDLIYDIEPGDRALLKSIEFTGNKIFKTNKLRNIITSEEDKFWKFISSKKFLNKEQLKLDERLLHRFYLDRGYYNIEISSVFAKLLDSGHFKIVFNINAGSVFKINEANLILPNDYDANNFKDINKHLSKIEGTKYSFRKINKIVDEIDKVSLLKEFEFINASIEENIVDNNMLNLNIVISETQKKYVERINIFGNSITQERVIRDQLLVDEGDAYNELLNTKSINNLKALNIFKSVTAKVSEGSTDLNKIVDITIEEKPTGEISLGAGVGTDGNTIGFAVSENNYMGKGIKLRTSIRLSTETARGQFSIINPNYKYTNKSLITNIQSSSTDKLSSNGYKSTKTGFSLGTRFEQYENLFFAPSINTYYESLDTNTGATAALRKQEGGNFDTSFKYALDYDLRNQKYMTSEGYRSIFSQSIPLLSDVYSLKNTYEIGVYNKLPNDMITNISFYASAINALSDEDVRVSDRIRLGSKRLRGFENGKTGPVDNGDYIGGNFASSINFSTTLPMFFQSIDSADVSYFVDMANVWGVDYSSSVGDSSHIRSSTGVIVNWFTPIGPLNFSLSQPISQASTDKTQFFQFNLGTTF